ncbi:MAG: hypothetical protein CMM02_08105 [Rhodopirellula sp.]|nr:hypothetical protein [Rhodopirellula sp.]|tara:strand:+ start:216 stop:824 length:609 start_codon:yes stop_codon:yes gene_type:complete
MRHDLNFTEIVHLTPELLITFQEDAKRALVGDGSCSLDNVAISCFASELCSCNRNPQSLELSSLMDFPIRLVAVRENVFVGCVAAGPLRDVPNSLLRRVGCKSSDLFVVSLCVASDARNGGIGRLLLDGVRRAAPSSDLYLTTRKMSDGSDTALDQFHRERLIRQHRFYTSEGFVEKVCPDQAFRLYVWEKSSQNQNLFRAT